MLLKSPSSTPPPPKSLSTPPPDPTAGSSAQTVPPSSTLPSPKIDCFLPASNFRKPLRPRSCRGGWSEPPVAPGWQTSASNCPPTYNYHHPPYQPESPSSNPHCHHPHSGRSGRWSQGPCDQHHINHYDSSIQIDNIINIIILFCEPADLPNGKAISPDGFRQSHLKKKHLQLLIESWEGGWEPTSSPVITICSFRSSTSTTPSM